jgi:hypothetical protein
MEKTHYRRVAKSDHLGVADLEDFIEQGSDLVFTIKEVKLEMGASVAGKKGNYNIAYFVEKIKPLVLNPTNGKILKTLTKTPFLEDWANLTIKLYIDENVSFAKERTGGVRIAMQLPQSKKEATKDYIDDVRFEKALKSIEDGEFSKEKLLAKFVLTADQLKKIGGV